MSDSLERARGDEQDGQCYGRLPPDRDGGYAGQNMTENVTGIEFDYQKGSSQNWAHSRPEADMFVEHDNPLYNMSHRERGKCLIFYYSDFNQELRKMQNLEPRPCAKDDKTKVQKSFELLGFEVEAFENLDRSDFLQAIFSESSADHSSRDCLAIVFMSHGTYDDVNKVQKLWLFDDFIVPSDLWKYFAGPKCPSLVGKPKLFFIQSCRGVSIDKGVKAVLQSGMPSCFDSLPEQDRSECYTLPSYADILVMWASYPGHFAFKSNNNGISGSVFIHFLCKVLEKEGTTRSLLHLLTSVARKVAIEYESFSPHNSPLNANKQIPIIESTLIRELYFYPKNASPKPTTL